MYFEKIYPYLTPFFFLLIQLERFDRYHMFNLFIFVGYPPCEFMFMCAPQNFLPYPM